MNGMTEKIKETPKTTEKTSGKPVEESPKKVEETPEAAPEEEKPEQKPQEKKAEKAKKKEKGAYTRYRIDEKGLTRLRPNCERCGPGYFMADHGDRYACGHCGFTRYKASLEEVA